MDLSHFAIDFSGVALPNAVSFWKRMGFTEVPASTSLDTYSTGAVFMQLSLKSSTKGAV